MAGMGTGADCAGPTGVLAGVPLWTPGIMAGPVAGRQMGWILQPHHGGRDTPGPVSYNGGGRGFLDPDHPAAAPGATKATMLAGINQAGAQGATVGELHRDTGLTRGQLAGALSRGIATADITRDGPYLPVFAGRPGYLYRLTRKGRGYLNGNGASSTSKGI